MIHALSLLALGALAPSPADAPIQVLVVGTFHMAAEPGPLNPTVADLLEPRRQAELDELVERLAAFRPTRVALEATPDAAILAEYERFLAGELELGLDERHQLGFRLARAADLGRVLGVDFPLTLAPEQILAWGQTNGQQDLAAGIFASYMEAAAAWNPQGFDALSMTEIYRAFNSDETDRRLRGVFASMIRIGSADEPVGADNLSRWYERNVRIVANTLRSAEPGDRIVVLYGANHRGILRELFEAVKGVEVVSAEDLLGG